MRVAGCRGIQRDLEVPQPLPQLPIIFLLREAIHRQQVEASTAVWGRGPRSGCPLLTSPDHLARPQSLPLSLQGPGDPGLGCSGLQGTAVSH